MKTKSTDSILFLGKEDDEYCDRAFKFVSDNFENVTSYRSIWGQALPAKIHDWHGNYLLSYLCRWVVPVSIIQSASKAAINFHPASPEYPGLGCTNYALYDDVSEYGVTCHHLAKKVDTGKIISVKRFPVFASDNVDSLLRRSYEFQLVLFYEIVGAILNGQPLSESNEIWTGQHHSREEFNKLGVIRPDMSDDEIARRVRAFSYGVFQPTVDISGFRFELKFSK